MASTTLVTFVLNSVHATTAVDVLGSWDNFSRPYPMQKDLQKGHGSWSGCHVFSNIICDGDPTDCCTPRDGGLLMGGTYWYYYRRNFDHEFHNPDEPSTSACPLLPGQRVNVLTIPDGPLAFTASSKDAGSDRLPMTMDPKDRLRAPLPASKVDRRALSSPRAAADLPKHMTVMYSDSLARLQTGVGDVVISAFMCRRKPDDLIAWKHPAATARKTHTSGHATLSASNTLDASCRLPPRKSRRPAASAKIGPHKAVDAAHAAHPARATREFTNPFLPSTLAHQPLSPSARPRTSIGIRTRAEDWSAILPAPRPLSCPSNLPSGLCRPQTLRPTPPTRPVPVLPSEVHPEQPEPHSEPFEFEPDAGMEWLNHPPEQLHLGVRQPNPALPASPELTPQTASPPQPAPPSRSKSQRLKRLASFKSRIKLPQVPQMPHMPHMPHMPRIKSRRPSTKHEVDDACDKRAVFNEISSTWTPAMTSPSETSPGFLSPETAARLDKPQPAAPPIEDITLPPAAAPVLMHSKHDVRPVAEYKAQREPRATRGDSLPRLMSNFLGGSHAGSDSPGTAKARYPPRGSSLPLLLSDNGAASSQETIKQTTTKPDDEHVAKFSLGPSPFVDQHTDTHLDPNTTAGRVERESFDEIKHRDQIRSLLRANMTATQPLASDNPSLGYASLHHDPSLHSHSTSFQQRGTEDSFGAESFEYLAGAIF